MEAASILICEFSNVVTPSENKLCCLLGGGAFKTLKKPKLILVTSLCNSLSAPMSHRTEGKDHRMVTSRERIGSLCICGQVYAWTWGPCFLEGDTSTGSQGQETDVRQNGLREEAGFHRLLSDVRMHHI